MNCVLFKQQDQLNFVSSLYNYLLYYMFEVLNLNETEFQFKLRRTSRPTMNFKVFILLVIVVFLRLAVNIQVPFFMKKKTIFKFINGNFVLLKIKLIDKRNH